jgi:hypothetical protein
LDPQPKKMFVPKRSYPVWLDAEQVAALELRYGSVQKALAHAVRQLLADTQDMAFKPAGMTEAAAAGAPARPGGMSGHKEGIRCARCERVGRVYDGSCIACKVLRDTSKKS